MANFYHRLLCGHLGWRIDVSVPLRRKCVICVAPHTSNWDFIIGELYIRAIGEQARFLMKREWFFWPLGVLLRRMGGVPVWRSRKTSLTDQLAARALQADTFRLAVTPEGTRRKVSKWKRGFYVIALKAQMPIQLYAIDYERKLITCSKEIVPQEGMMEAHMAEIMDYYRTFRGRYPRKFQVEETP